MFKYRLTTLALAFALALTAITGITAQEKKEKSMEPLRLGVILYEGFELLDVFGPVEMFTNVGPQLDVLMIAEEAGPVASVSGSQPGKPGPKAVADYSFADTPDLDLILVPGGFGSFQQEKNPALIEFLKERAPKAQITTSVCSGSGILAAAGLLNDRRATSNKVFFSMITGSKPGVEWVKEARWVDDGNMVTSSGVSAGMDMALAVIERLFGTEMAENIAVGTEYEWHRDPDEDPFVKYLK